MSTRSGSVTPTKSASKRGSINEEVTSQEIRKVSLSKRFYRRLCSSILKKEPSTTSYGKVLYSYFLAVNHPSLNLLIIPESIYLVSYCMLLESTWMQACQCI